MFLGGVQRNRRRSHAPPGRNFLMSLCRSAFFSKLRWFAAFESARTAHAADGQRRASTFRAASPVLADVTKPSLTPRVHPDVSAFFWMTG